MSLLFCDSFDHYTTADMPAKGWTNSATNIGAFGRHGTNGIRNTNSNFYAELAIGTTVTGTIIIGCGYRYTNGPTEVRGVWNLYDGTTGHLGIYVNASGYLEIRRGPVYGGSTLLATGSTLLASGSWYFLEGKFSISDTAGIVQMRVNGVAETLTFVTGNATNQDTRNGGNAQVDIMRFSHSQAAVAQTVDMDDLYICDTNGGVADDFLGDVRVEAIFPSGNGNSSQLVGSDSNSTDNYLLVDETAPNGDTDYVESSTVGEKDTYAYGNVTPTAGTVIAVVPQLYVRKTDAGTRSVASVARLSGTEVDSADHSLGAAYAYRRDVRHTKPGGGAWTISDVNSAEFGVKVTA